MGTAGAETMTLRPPNANHRRRIRKRTGSLAPSRSKQTGAGADLLLLLSSLLVATAARGDGSVSASISTDYRQPQPSQPLGGLQRQSSSLRRRRRSLEMSEQEQTLLIGHPQFITEMGVFDEDYAAYDASFLTTNADADEDDAPNMSTMPQARIVGGHEAEWGRYPWYVSLQVRGYPICAGFLIARDIVMTAAHCSGSYDVILGLHDRTQTSTSATEHYEEFAIDESVVHPEFDRHNGALINDFRILKLNGYSDKTPLKLDCDPHALPPGALSNGEVLTVMGFGRTSFGGPGSTVLQDAHVNYVPNNLCRRAQGCVAGQGCYSYQNVITDSMMCAMGDGTDSCQGDSGGPLIKRGADASKDRCVGVVSFGVGCADPNFPGVYGRISTACQWIEETVMELSDFGLPTDSLTSAPSAAPTQDDGGTTDPADAAADDGGGGDEDGVQEQEIQKQKKRRRKYRMDEVPTDDEADDTTALLATNATTDDIENHTIIDNGGGGGENSTSSSPPSANVTKPHQNQNDTSPSAANATSPPSGEEDASLELGAVDGKQVVGADGNNETFQPPPQAAPGDLNEAAPSSGIPQETSTSHGHGEDGNGTARSNATTSVRESLGQTTTMMAKRDQSASLTMDGGAASPSALLHDPSSSSSSSSLPTIHGHAAGPASLEDDPASAFLAGIRPPVKLLEFPRFRYRKPRERRTPS